MQLKCLFRAVSAGVFFFVSIDTNIIENEIFVCLSFRNLFFMREVVDVLH